MFNTNRRPSTLAAIAATAASSASPVVRFSVVHRTRPMKNGARFPAAAVTDVPVAESLTFCAAGSGVEVKTWPSTSPERAAPQHKDRPGLSVDTEADRFIYEGALALNPNFLYESTRSTEVLFGIGRQWGPDFQDSIMVAALVEEVAAAAAEKARAPILFLQSPVAPYSEPSPRHREDGSGEEPRPAAGLCIRASVGIDESRAEDRLALQEAFSDIAESYGLGLHVGDTRLNRVQGEWWTVLPPRPEVYAQRKSEIASFAPQTQPSTAVLVTVVGPARVGSTLAIARELTARRIGALAFSISALQEIAFINLLLPIAPPRNLPTPLSPYVSDALTAIRLLASDCGLTPSHLADTASARPFDAAADYLCVTSGPVGVEFPAPDDEARSQSHPLWVTWEMPENAVGVDVESVLAGCAEDQEEVSVSCVDYSRSRRLSNGRTRGRMKLSVAVMSDLAGRARADLLGEISVTVQTAAVAEIVASGVAQREFSLRVAWRERWVGSWDSF